MSPKAVHTHFFIPKFTELEMITILGVPGVMNKIIIICKKSINSKGSILRDSPKKPGAKDG